MGESAFFDAASADLLVKIGWLTLIGVGSLAAGVISTLLWGRGGRKRLLTDIAELKAKAATVPAINFSPSITVNSQEVRHTDIEGAIGQQTDSRVIFGTVHGPISVSLHGGTETAADLVHWLHDKRLLAPLKDE